MAAAMDTADPRSSPGCMDVAAEAGASVPIGICGPRVSRKRLRQLKKLQGEIASHLGQSEKSTEKLGPSFSQILWPFLTVCVIPETGKTVGFICLSRIRINMNL